MTINESAPATNQGIPNNETNFLQYTQQEYSIEEKQLMIESLLKAFEPGIREKLQNAIYKTFTTEITLQGENASNLSALLPPLPVTKASAILSQEFPKLNWLVEDFLSPGLCFIYGKPKTGKSWLFLQLALAVTTGGRFLEKPVQKGKVLYLALEDTDRRFQGRMKKQGWNSQAADNLDVLKYREFKKRIGCLNSNGGKLLMSYVDSQKYRLVCVDTYSRAMKGEQMKVDEVTEAISEIQQFALQRDIYFVIIDHESKGGDTPFGSIAKLAVLDVAWRLFKEKGVGTKLQIEGRDLEDEYLLRLKFDRDNAYWINQGNANEYELSEKRQKIIEAIAALQPITAKDISEAIQSDLSNTVKQLNELESSGAIRKEGRLYSVTSK